MPHAVAPARLLARRLERLRLDGRVAHDVEELRQEAEWIDAMRVLRPEPEKIYSWWSYRSPDWAAADKGRRLDHIWLSKGLKDTLRTIDVTRDTRGWERPSDHAPVTAVLEL